MTPISCPRCFESLSSKTYHDTQIEFCRSCGGLLLDCTELDAVAEDTEGSVEYSISHHTNDTSQDDTPLMSCPKCPDKPTMLRIRFIGHADIFLDRCNRCALLWLDYNEIAHVNQNIRRLNNSEGEWSFWQKVRIWSHQVVV